MSMDVKIIEYLSDIACMNQSEQSSRTRVLILEWLVFLLYQGQFSVPGYHFLVFLLYQGQFSIMGPVGYQSFFSIRASFRSQVIIFQSFFSIKGPSSLLQRYLFESLMVLKTLCCHFLVFLLYPSQVSILGPVGYGPTTLPLRHSDLLEKRMSYCDLCSRVIYDEIE